MSKPWYEALYEYFPDYDEEPYTQNTEAEVDFIEATIGEDRGKRILDVGCGTGRHARALARRGYKVVGVDLSNALLARARQTARLENLDVAFIRHDARDLHFEREFDVVMSLCEGAFSLMESDDMDLRILENMSRALRSPAHDGSELAGILILTAPNAAFMLAQDSGDGSFDRTTLRERFTLEVKGEDGVEKTLTCTQRYYTQEELDAILGELGFLQVSFFAVTADGYDRTRMPSPKEFELGVIALK
jgi:SAM-dependent methyltransferase